MQKFNFIIIEDEPLAREIIRTYSERLDNIKLTGEFSSALSAVSDLNSPQCDFAFLDINMPNFSGLDLIKSVKNPPEFIITTAYREFAVEAFELNATDYLVKPFSFERFLQAVNKVMSKLNHIPRNNFNHEKEFIVVKSDSKFIKVDINDILYIEAYREYIKIHTQNSGVIIPMISMKSAYDMLPKDLFFRIHRSYIISIKHLDYIQGYEAIINKKTLPISREAKDEFIQFLQTK